MALQKLAYAITMIAFATNVLRKGRKVKIERKLVDKEKNIVQITTEDERWYLVDGKYIPSVTWIASFYPKGIGFYKWLANTGWDESESLKNEAGDRGSAVHKAIESLVAGGEVYHDSIFEVNGIARELSADEYEAVLSFARWWDSIKPKLIASEFVTINEEYAGTIDLKIEIDGEVWIVDIKTSSDIWPSHEIQLSAYAKNEGVEKMGIIQVGYKRNKNKYKFTEIQDQFDLFLAAKQIWSKETSGQSPLQRDLPLSIKL